MYSGFKIIFISYVLLGCLEASDLTGGFPANAFSKLRSARRALALLVLLLRSRTMRRISTDQYNVAPVEPLCKEGLVLLSVRAP